MFLLVQGSMDIIHLHLGQGNPTPVQPTQEETLNHSTVAQGNYLTMYFRPTFDFRRNFFRFFNFFPLNELKFET